MAVVGGGFSGTLTAVQLLRRAEPGTRVLLIERSGDFGPGVAYGTPDDRHVLNVPAARMSACADEPDDLVGWAAVAPDAYLPRRVFGEYLRARLAAAAARSAARLERMTGEVRRIRPAPGALELVLDGGRHVACDRAVLALGALPAAAPCELPGDPRVVADPWRPGALAAVADALRGDAPAHAVLIGSGPTAVDVALTLCGEAPGARVTLVSRNGRLPFAHLPGLRPPAPPPFLPAGPLRLRTLERVLRAHVAQAERAGYDWRDAVDGLRPLVPRLWAALPDADRRAFADGANRRWEIRRHRLAPAVAAELAGLRRAGRLRVVRGAVAGVDARLTVRSANGGGAARGRSRRLRRPRARRARRAAAAARPAHRRPRERRSARARAAVGARRRAARPPRPRRRSPLDARRPAPRRAVGIDRGAGAARAGGDRRGGGLRVARPACGRPGGGARVKRSASPTFTMIA